MLDHVDWLQEKIGQRSQEPPTTTVTPAQDLFFSITFAGVLIISKPGSATFAATTILAECWKHCRGSMHRKQQQAVQVPIQVPQEGENLIFL